MEEALSNYRLLLGKLDDFFAHAQEKYAAVMHCGPGCDDCCHTQLSVFSFEVALLVEAVGHLSPAVRQAIVARARQAEKDPQSPCPLLVDQQCLVYAQRPVICRTHGLALLVPESGELSVCPRNFLGSKHIDGDCVLDLTPVNQLLSTLGRILTQQGELGSLRSSLNQALLEAWAPDAAP